jgi:hypothetical protein
MCLSRGGSVVSSFQIHWCLFEPYPDIHSMSSLVFPRLSVSVPFECCSRRVCGHPPIAFQQRSIVAGPGECPPCPGSWTWHCRLYRTTQPRGWWSCPSGSWRSCNVIVSLYSMSLSLSWGVAKLTSALKTQEKLAEITIVMFKTTGMTYWSRIVNVVVDVGGSWISSVTA